MSEVRTSGSLLFTEPNNPTRVGEIINTLNEIYDIPMPRLGMSVYVKDEGVNYTITKLEPTLIEGVLVPDAKVAGYELQTGIGKSIAWNSSSNINDYVVAGVYNITGERLNVNDGLPIANSNPGHTISARLVVLDSSIKGTGDSQDKCITQVLTLSNRTGEDGNMYIRTGHGGNINSLSWEPWATLQTNTNVKRVEDLDKLIDNGIYSGVWLRGTDFMTFVCVVINDYALSSSPRRVSQFIYGLNKVSGNVEYLTRIGEGDTNIVWGSLKIINEDKIAKMISDEIAKVVADAPETFDTLKEIAEWIENHGTEVADILAAINANANNLTETKKDIANQLIVTPVADKVAITGRNEQSMRINFSTDIPAATTEKAGVMSAEDKVALDAVGYLSNKAVYTFNDGAIINDAPSTNELYKYTSPIRLLRGETIQATFVCSGANAISLTNENGSSYINLVQGSSLEPKKYGYTAKSNCYVSLCWRSASDETTPYVSILQASTEQIINIKGVGSSAGINVGDIYLDGSGVLYKKTETGFIRQSFDVDSIYVINGQEYSYDGKGLVLRNNDAVSRLRYNMREADYDIVYDMVVMEEGVESNSNYCISTPILLKKEETIAIKCIGIGMSIISQCDDSGNFIASLVRSTTPNRQIYEYTATRECYVRVCWRKETTYAKPVFVKIYKDFSIYKSKENVFESVGGRMTPDLMWNSGYIYNNKVNQSALYQYSEPIPLKQGDIVTVKTSGNGFDCVSQYDGGSYTRLLNVDVTDINAVKTFNCIIPKDADIVFCVKNTSEHSVSIYRPMKDVLIPSTSNTGNLTIVAAKEHHYTDGTLPVIEWYLLCDLATKTFYYSKDLVAKKILFTFEDFIVFADSPQMAYTFGIMPNNDIIAVRLASSLPLTSSEDNRMNPYVFKANEQWKIAHEVDFGSRLKPCGWLENCGFLAMPNGDTMFTEYTRISVETCNVWKITGDALNAENWSVKKSFTLSGKEDAGLKHLHAVQNDPYTGYIYISTGDYEVSSIYVSKDNGETFEVVLENNEGLCRSLAMTFTPNNICYANDSNQHKFIKATRNSDGVMDLGTAEVLELPKTPKPSGGYDNIACYGQAYIPEYNAALVLDRQDGGGEVLEFPLYVVELDTLEYKVVGKLKGIKNGFGFRTLFTEWYPRNGEIHFGFGVDWYTSNKIKACGNISTDKGDGTQTNNNLVFKISKDGDIYRMNISTLYI